ncbi:hypothetical protein ACHWQZ_G007776 [Mnemiopsis leidyi]
MSSSKSRDETVNALYTSLSETGGSDVFNKLSAAHFCSSSEQFKNVIRSVTPSSAFPVDGSLNEEVLLRSVNKNVLAEWLGTAIDILERAASQIQGAADLETQICSADAENKSLLKEKVEDQRTIIKIQNQLIVKEQERVHSFKETVQKEVQSYAGVVASSCATPLSPKKLQTVVICICYTCTQAFTVILKGLLEDSRSFNGDPPHLTLNHGFPKVGIDTTTPPKKYTRHYEDRSRNIMTHGLAKKNGEDFNKSVADIFSEIGEKPMFSVPCRVGKPAIGSVRPVKVSFPSASIVPALLSKSSKLRQSDIFKNTFISPERSSEERAARRTLILELRQKRMDEPDSSFIEQLQI